MKLLVRNLARSTTEPEVKALFESFGAVQSCALVLDAKSGGSKGFAFVEMPKPGEAKAATKNLNGKEVDGKTIRVKKAEVSEQVSEEATAETKKAASPETKSRKDSGKKR